MTGLRKTFVCFTISTTYANEWWGNGGCELWHALTGGGCKCAFTSNAQAFYFIERAKEIPGWEDEPFAIRESDDRADFAGVGRWVPGLRDLRPVQKA